jgi:hypothetical protein
MTNEVSISNNLFPVYFSLVLCILQTTGSALGGVKGKNGWHMYDDQPIFWYEPDPWKRASKQLRRLKSPCNVYNLWNMRGEFRIDSSDWRW